MDELKKIHEKVNLLIFLVIILNVITSGIIFFNADWVAFSNKSHIGNVGFYLFAYLPIFYFLFKNLISLGEIFRGINDYKNGFRILKKGLVDSIICFAIMLFCSFFVIYATETARIIDWLSYLEKLNFIISIYILNKCKKLTGGTI
jgi:hypothetical protein